MPDITLLKACWRQGNVGHQRRELRVLTSGRQEFNDNAGVSRFDLINQQRQVFTGVLSDTKKQWKYPHTLGSSCNQLRSRVG